MLPTAVLPYFLALIGIFFFVGSCCGVALLEEIRGADQGWPGKYTKNSDQLEDLSDESEMRRLMWHMEFRELPTCRGRVLGWVSFLCLISGTLLFLSLFLFFKIRFGRGDFQL